MQLVTLVPTDPHILQRLGAMYDDSNDQSQAYQYHYESFRYCPTNIDVISWLGAYYMESQYADKAVNYFEKAALIQPTQINWHLMVASCHRKIGQRGGGGEAVWMWMERVGRGGSEGDAVSAYIVDVIWRSLNSHLQGITTKLFNVISRYTSSFPIMSTVSGFWSSCAAI